MIKSLPQIIDEVDGQLQLQRDEADLLIRRAPATIIGRYFCRWV
jgi:hypothetical protein